MGTRGTKRLNKYSTVSIDCEKMLFTSVDSLLAIAQHNNLYKGDELEIEELIGLISDIEIQYLPLDSSISGLLKRENDKWLIVVNLLHHKHRQKFTLGHELAHYVLHKNDSDNFTDTTFFRGLSNDNIERSANDFASKLLMPETSVRRLIDEQNVRSIEVLSEKFGVSAAAMLYRVKQLGYNTKE